MRAKPEPHIYKLAVSAHRKRDKIVRQKRWEIRVIGQRGRAQPVGRARVVCESQDVFFHVETLSRKKLRADAPEALLAMREQGSTWAGTLDP